MQNQPTANNSFSLFDRLAQIRSKSLSWIWDHPTGNGLNLATLARAILRVIFIVVREIRHDRITLRASALTFTVVLSLVPMLALGTAVLKGLGAGDQMRQAAYRFIDQLEEPSAPQAQPDAVQPQTSAIPELPTDGHSQSGGAQEGALPADSSLTSHLRKAVDQTFDYVDRTDFAALGAFGITGLVLAVLSMLSSIEQSMNTIWQAMSDRPFGRKLIDYLALMILLPITINLALATEATLQSPSLLAHFQSILPMAWFGRLLLSMLPIIALVATFTILYRFIPNTKVRLLPALAGGICGGLGWLVVQMFYIKLQIGVARYNAIYGSFATLPLLLLWIYIGWVVFLAGAELAFALQFWRRYSWKDQVLSPIARLSIAYGIVGAAMANFHERQPTEINSLATLLNQPPTAIGEILAELRKGGILRQINDETNSYVPAAPEEEINPAELIDIILGTDIPKNSWDSLAAKALQAARESVTDTTIPGSIIRPV